MDFPAFQRVLDATLHAGRFAAADDLHGAFLPPVQPDAPLRRVGLALEPGPRWLAWVGRERPDALFLHRPWRMDPDARRALETAGVGVLAYHLAFDEALTTGFNPALAAACGWGEPAPFAEKEGRPLGMICTPPAGPVSWESLVRRLAQEFGGLEGTREPAAGAGVEIERVACVGAMNGPLVRAADAEGVGGYVTGQWREPARAAVVETGIGVIGLGHGRSERWGLRTLGRLLRENPALGQMEVLVFDEPAS